MKEDWNIPEEVIIEEVWDDFDFIGINMWCKSLLHMLQLIGANCPETFDIDNLVDCPPGLDKDTIVNEIIYISNNYMDILTNEHLVNLINSNDASNIVLAVKLHNHEETTL